MQSEKGEYEGTFVRLKRSLQIYSIVPLQQRDQQLQVEENKKIHQRFEAGDPVVFIGDIDVGDRHPADNQGGDVKKDP